jgi:hypothetical protein
MPDDKFNIFGFEILTPNISHKIGNNTMRDAEGYDSQYCGAERRTLE